MTPELQFLIESIDTRLESIDARTRAIETHVAERAGAEKVRRRVGEFARWTGSVLMGGLGLAAGHYWPHAH